MEEVASVITPYLLFKKNFPECLQPYKSKLKRIYVGGCYYGLERSADMDNHKELAHTHNEYGTSRMCVFEPRFLKSKYLMLHEIAHILCHGEDHTDKWRRCLLNIGGTLDSFRVGSITTCSYHQDGNYPGSANDNSLRTAQE